MRAKLNVILLLDELSRRDITVDLTELSVNGVTVISSLDEIAGNGKAPAKDVVILSKYILIEGAVRTLKLYKSIFNLNYIYIGTDPEFLNFMSTIAECYIMDITNLNYEKMSAIVFRDSALLKRYEVNSVANSKTIKKIARNIISNGTSSDDVKTLARATLALSDVNEHLCNVLETTQGIAETNERRYISQKEIAEILVKAYTKMIRNAQRTNLSLEQYEYILSKDVYRKVSALDYRNPPHILYLKEYQELIHMESLLWTIKTSLNKQMQKSVKILKLYDSAGSRRAILNPKEYYRLSNKFVVTDITSNDYLIKVGDYTQVLEILFRNSVGVDVLIIVDCKDHNDVVVSGNYTLFNMCRNIKNLPTFNLNKANTIVNNSRSELSWNTYKELHKMVNEADKLIYLSSKPVIQKIMKQLTIGLEGF